MNLSRTLTLCVVFFAAILHAEPAAPQIKARDLNGALVDSKALLQKGPVIVWFWSACCGLKKPQLRALKTLNEAYKDSGLTVLAVNEDDNKKASAIGKAIHANAITFTVIPDPNGDLYKSFHCFGMPAVYVIKTTGEIVYSRVGFVPGDEKALEKQVRLLFGVGN